MQKRMPQIDLEEVVDAPPPLPLTDAQAERLARRVFGARGAVQRKGRACIVGRREKRRSRGIEALGTGASWEKAFDVALVNVGR